MRPLTCRYPLSIEALPLHLREHTVPAETLAATQATGRLWVALTARGEPTRFALAQTVGTVVMLAEGSVHPDHGRRGVGRALVEAVVAWARVSGFEAVALTTFAALPWNGPFCARLGFRRLSTAEISPDLARALRKGEADGLSGRVAIQLDLAAA